MAGLEWLDTGQGWVVTAGPGPEIVAGPEKSARHWAGMVGDGWNGPAIVAETGRRLGQTGGGIWSGAG